MRLKDNLVRKFLAWTALAVLLSACTVPGMQVREGQSVNSDNDDVVPIFVALTPAVVQKANAETAQSDMWRSEALKLAGKPASYTIGPADILSIIVWDHPELVIPNVSYQSTTTSVSTTPTSVGLASQALPGYVVGPNGEVQFPYVKHLKLSGLTEDQAREKLTRLLAGYINDPQITIRVIGYLSKKVYIEGGVTSPGVKSITSVPMTLAEAINEAGGISALGSQSAVQLIRGGKTFSIDIPSFEKIGISAQNIPLSDGDIVRVLPLADQRVYVSGEVLRPGSIPFRTDGSLSLNEAISDAGGVLPTTSDPRSIYVVRNSGDPAAPLVFNLDAKDPTALAMAQRFKLAKNDVVYIDAPGLVRWSRVISLLTGSASGANSIRNAVGN